MNTGGGGGVGIQGVQLATAMGLRSIVVDTGDEREKLAKHHGAEHFLDFQKEEDTVKKALEITGGGAHAVFVTAVQAYPTAPGYLGHRAGAKVMWCVQGLWMMASITDVEQHWPATRRQVPYRPRSKPACLPQPVDRRHTSQQRAGD